MIPNFVNYDDNCYNVVAAHDTDDVARLDGFTVRGGNADGDWTLYRDVAGGMYIGLGQTVVTDCIFRENRADYAGGGLYIYYEATPEITTCSFIDNYSGNHGGGVYCEEADPILYYCIFSGNSTPSTGGGMSNFDSNPTLTGCDFDDNTSMFGGGMYNSMWTYPCTPVLTNCTFTGNTGEYGGGGMLNWGGNPELTDCTFTSNSAGTGGGLQNDPNSNPTLTNCIFEGNSAYDGGGMDNDDSSPTLVNCLFKGNSAERYGGGIAHYSLADDGPILLNCSFCGNTAGEEGGGICNSGLDPTPTLTNVILWANADVGGMDESAQLHVHSGVPVLTYSCIQDCTTFCADPNDHNIGDDPLFLDPNGPDGDPNTWADNDYHLTADSPVIDTGNNNAVPPGVTTDLDGNTRIVDGDQNGSAIVDLGPYEFFTSCAGQSRGDCNGDGSINSLDIDPYVEALVDPAQFNLDYDPITWQCAADINCDGSMNSLDIDPFVECLTGGCPDCPE